mmetsp:Transcript_51307/g.88283  ORF Transcript_51307/g.88283 Transcript_51307/m.88283 type:complete len:111 (+) Transcript_51307:126-458(+)
MPNTKSGPPVSEAHWPKLTPRLSQELLKVSPGGGGGGSGGAIYLARDLYGLADPSSPECVACLTDPKDIAFLPCRHLTVCAGCARHVDRCPVCRSEFEAYVRFDRPAETA